MDFYRQIASGLGAEPRFRKNELFDNLNLNLPPNNLPKIPPNNLPNDNMYKDENGNSVDRDGKRSLDEIVQFMNDGVFKKRLEGVVEIDLLQTRIFGSKIYVDVEIQADGSYTLQKAHNIAEAVHDDIERNFPKVKHFMVHVKPVK